MLASSWWVQAPAVRTATHNGSKIEEEAVQIVYTMDPELEKASNNSVLGAPLVWKRPPSIESQNIFARGGSENTRVVTYFQASEGGLSGLSV